MNAQEALEIITNAIQSDNMTAEQDKALAIAQKALEKQIPEKLILGDDEQDYVRCPECKREIAAMEDCLLYHCPSCGEKDAILQGDNYCFNCGQALDWQKDEKGEIR